MPGGTSVGKLSVQLDANTKPFKRAMAQVQGSLDKLGQSMRPVAVASTAAFAGMTAGIISVTKAADTQRRAELKLAAAIRGTGAAIDIENIKAYASELQDLTAIGDEVTIEAAAMLTTFQLTEQQVMSLLPRIQNLSTMYGMDLNQAAIAVGKTMTAGAGALSRYGIALGDAEKKAFNFGSTTKKVSILMEALDKNTGPAAETLKNTAGGAFQELTGRVGDLQEVFGFIVESPITHMMQRLSGLVKDATTWFSALSPETKEFAGKAALVGTAVLGITAALAGMIVVLPFVTAGFSTLAAGVNAALWPVVVVIAAIAGVIVNVILAVGLLRRIWESNIGGIQEKTMGFLVAVGKAWFSYRDSFKIILKDAVKGWLWMINKLTSTWNTFIDLYSEGLNAIAGIVGASIDTSALKFSGVAVDTSDIDKLFSEGGGLVKKIASGIVGVGETAIDEIAETFMVGADTIFSPIADKIKEIFPSLSTATAGVSAPADIIAGGGGGGGGVSAKAAETSSVISEGLAEFGQTLLNKLGEAGSLMSTVLGKLASGDVIGGLISASVGLLASTKGFQKIINIVTNLFNMVVQLIGPVIEAVAPLLNALASVAQLVIQLWMAFNFIKPLISALAAVLKVVANIIQGFVRGVAGVWNFIIDVIASIISVVSDSAADWVRRQRIVIRNFSDDIGDEDGSGMGGSLDDAADNFDRAADATSDFGDTIREVNAKLLNTPRGFKAALRRFQSISSEMMGGGRPLLQTGLVGAGAGAGGAVFEIENLVIATDDPAEMRSKIEDEAKWDRTTSGDSSIGSGHTYSIPDAGG